MRSIVYTEKSFYRWNCYVANGIAWNPFLSYFCTKITTDRSDVKQITYGDTGLLTYFTYNECTIWFQFFLRISCVRWLVFRDRMPWEKLFLFVRLCKRENILADFLCMKILLRFVERRNTFFMYSFLLSSFFYFSFLRVKMDNGIKPCSVIVMCYVAVVVHLLLLFVVDFFF